MVWSALALAQKDHRKPHVSCPLDKPIIDVETWQCYHVQTSTSGTHVFLSCFSLIFDGVNECGMLEMWRLKAWCPTILGYKFSLGVAAGHLHLLAIGVMGETCTYQMR
jgi:hypothetical protein